LLAQVALALLTTFGAMSTIAVGQFRVGRLAVLNQRTTVQRLWKRGPTAGKRGLETAIRSTRTGPGAQVEITAGVHEDFERDLRQQSRDGVRPKSERTQAVISRATFVETGAQSPIPACRDAGPGV